MSTQYLEPTDVILSFLEDVQSVWTHVYDRDAEQEKLLQKMSDLEELQERAKQQAEKEEAIEEDESSEEEREEEFELPKDVFTMMFFANVFSASFLYGFVIFGFQLTILIVITIDLLSDEVRLGEVDGDRLNVPVQVEWQVRVAQVLAIMISVMSRDDCLDTFKILVIGWKKRWWRIFPGATMAQFALMNIMRFSQGAYVIFVSFIFIVQSDNVLDLFLNFAAIEFVASLDNLAYEVAEDGWIVKGLVELSEKIQNEGAIILLEKDQEKLAKYPNAKKFLMGSLLLVLYVGLYRVIQLQSGELLEGTTCGSVEIKFGEEIFDFSSANPEEYDGLFVDPDRSGREVQYLVDSIRPLPPSLDTKFPSNFRYSYFSGVYVSDYSEVIADRPVYYERGLKDPTSGKFYYCDDEKAWVFTVGALGLSGALPKATKDRCGADGWMAHSPITDAYSLDEVEEVGWKIWTGSLVDAETFSAACAECSIDLDCSIGNGVCSDGQCMCNEDFSGVFCTDPTPCEELGKYSDKSFEILQTNSGARAYSRPFYTISRQTYVEAMFYTGLRWYMAKMAQQDIAIYQKDFGEERNPDEYNDYFNLIFHAFWGNLNLESALLISEPTTSLTPTGPIEWTKFLDPRTIGSYGSYGHVEEDILLQFECLSSRTCERPIGLCGNFGSCVYADNMTFWGDSVVTPYAGYQCKCSDTFTGHFCEYENAAIVVNGTLVSNGGKNANIDPYGGACAGPFKNYSNCWELLY